MTKKPVFVWTGFPYSPSIKSTLWTFRINLGLLLSHLLWLTPFIEVAKCRTFLSNENLFIVVTFIALCKFVHSLVACIKTSWGYSRNMCRYIFVDCKFVLISKKGLFETCKFCMVDKCKFSPMVQIFTCRSMPHRRRRGRRWRPRPASCLGRSCKKCRKPCVL